MISELIDKAMPIITYVWHVALLVLAAYASTHAEWAWLSPALQATGQLSRPPDAMKIPAKVMAVFSVGACAWWYLV